jgi:hypothetical protein
VPRRDDLHTILVIGSGPIVIGQACEFDYSGTQACRALREEGYRVVLVNSNPATIMTDPETADRTYVEPMTLDSIEKIIARERPDALLPTIGGQTALNLSVELAESGILARHGVELIGANLEAILKAEDRERFAVAMRGIGLSLPESGYARSLDRKHRLQRGRVLSAGRMGTHPVATRGVHDRAERPRLEGIRTRGHARPQGQRRHRLFHRELRRDGRPHRRFHHGGSRADADR